MKCLCGCQNETNPGRKYIKHHHLKKHVKEKRVVPLLKSTKTKPFKLPHCSCCGNHQNLTYVLCSSCYSKKNAIKLSREKWYNGYPKPEEEENEEETYEAEVPFENPEENPETNHIEPVTDSYETTEPTTSPSPTAEKVTARYLWSRAIARIKK